MEDSQTDSQGWADQGYAQPTADAFLLPDKPTSERDPDEEFAQAVKPLPATPMTTDDTETTKPLHESYHNVGRAMQAFLDTAASALKDVHAAHKARDDALAGVVELEARLARLEDADSRAQVLEEENARLKEELGGYVQREVEKEEILEEFQKVANAMSAKLKKQGRKSM